MRVSLRCAAPILLSLALAAGPDHVRAAAQSAPVAVDNSQVRMSIGEAALLEWLQAATPFRLTVGRQPLQVELIFSEPSSLTLQDGKASLKIRARSSSLPIDQVLAPVVTITYDRNLNKYFGVMSSLPLQIPGLGSIDLKDSVPRFEIPPVLEDLWRFPDRSVGVGLNIRRLAIQDHRLEIGADVVITPVTPAGGHGAP